MSKTIATEVFTYAELSDEAKEKAREWYLCVDEPERFAFKDLKDDAERIGIRIVALSDRRSNQGGFITSAPESAESIMREHGKDCETYKTAKAYLKELEALGGRPSDSDAAEESTDIAADDGDWEDRRYEMDTEFLRSLLEDYRIMLEKEIDCLRSEESVAENIDANEYTFTAEGECFG